MINWQRFVTVDSKPLENSRSRNGFDGNTMSHVAESEIMTMYHSFGFGFGYAANAVVEHF